MTPELQAAVSSLLGQHQLPPWLIGCVTRQARRIGAFREAEAQAPQLSVVKEQIERFRDAVVDLKDGINDPTLMAFVGYDRTGLSISDHAVVEFLDRLSSMSHQAILRIAEKPTVALAYPRPDELSVSAKMLCAFTVQNVMQMIRKVDAIGPDNPDAHAAANALWKASGGQPLGSRNGDREPSGWRHHFIFARQAERGGDDRAQWLAHELAIFRALSPSSLENADGL